VGEKPNQPFQFAFNTSLKEISKGRVSLRTVA
jgi:hypothetical protein